MNKIKYQSNGQPVVIDFEDLREKLGYKVYKPRIGSVGKALIKAAGVNEKACKKDLPAGEKVEKGKSRSSGWLKHQLDELFKKDRKSHFSKGKKRNVKTK